MRMAQPASPPNPTNPTQPNQPTNPITKYIIKPMVFQHFLLCLSLDIWEASLDFWGANPHTGKNMSTPRAKGYNFWACCSWVCCSWTPHFADSRNSNLPASPGLLFLDSAFRGVQEQQPISQLNSLVYSTQYSTQLNSQQAANSVVLKCSSLQDSIVSQQHPLVNSTH